MALRHSLQQLHRTSNLQTNCIRYKYVRFYRNNALSTSRRIAPSWLTHRQLRCSSHMSFSSSWKYGGVLTEPLPDSEASQGYQFGQFFIHKRLGYIGIVVTNFDATIQKCERIDTEIAGQRNDMSQIPIVRRIPAPLIRPCNNYKYKQGVHLMQESKKFEVYRGEPGSDCLDTKEVRWRELPGGASDGNHTYYQVLCNLEENSKFDINPPQLVLKGFAPAADTLMIGLDYCKHTDIVPFNSENLSFEHPVKQQLYHGKDNLDYWVSRTKEKCPRTIYVNTEHDIQVTGYVMSAGSEVSSNPGEHVCWFVYTFNFHNLSDTPMKLIRRTLVFLSDDDECQIVSGEGVVGVEPLLHKENPCYQYTSTAAIQTRRGRMGGEFIFESLENSQVVRVSIPTMELRHDSGADEAYQGFNS
eukprot:m.29305 g.29305  ORF g.29305 m.29305 type:complete len:414 (+) comp8089_c0_seq2:153-1394(+)